MLQGCMIIFYLNLKKKNHFVFPSCYVVRRSNGTHSIYKRQTKLWVFNIFHFQRISKAAASANQAEAAAGKVEYL